MSVNSPAPELTARVKPNGRVKVRVRVRVRISVSLNKNNSGVGELTDKYPNVLTFTYLLTYLLIKCYT